MDHESLISACAERNLEEARRLLVGKGAKSLINQEAHMALLLAAGDGHAEMVALLIAAGADVKAKTSNGVTALLVAAFNGHAEVVSMLLSAGTDVNARDKNGWTPLIMASISGHEEILSMLLSAGADVNAKDKDGKTPLIHAISEDHLRIAEIILDYGENVNVDAKTRKGLTARDYANEKGMRYTPLLTRIEDAARKYIPEPSTLAFHAKWVVPCIVIAAGVYRRLKSQSRV